MLTFSIASANDNDNLKINDIESSNIESNDIEKANTSNVASASKAKETPEVRKMLAAFKRQEHRLELNGCEMLYNGTPFRLDMTLKELETIFGPHDFKNRNFYVWKGAGIVFVIKTLKQKNSIPSAQYIYVYMNDLYKYDYDDGLLKHRQYKKKDFLLWNSLPINRQTTVKDIFFNSTFTLNDFEISDSDYSLTYPCANRELLYSIDTRGNWAYSGRGHLRLKSHPNQNNTSKVGNFFIKEIKN